MLEDAKKLADLRVENDDVVAMCYRSEGAPRSLSVARRAACVSLHGFAFGGAADRSNGGKRLFTVGQAKSPMDSDLTSRFLPNTNSLRRHL